AMMLIGEVWEKYKFNLTIGDLVEHSTISALAQHIGQAEANRGLVMPLNKPYEGQASLFMLPPILGTPVVFYALAHLLEAQDVNCYGLQYKGFAQEETLDKDIETMAQSFFVEMQTQLSHIPQPITILGYSMGALIGFELVHLLEQAGYTCQLILLDKEAFSADNRAFRVTLQKDNRAVAQKLWETHCRNTGLQFSASEDRRMQHFLWHYWSVHNQYLLTKKIEAPILAIEAAQEKDNAMKAWKKYTKGRFERHKLPTDHFGLLQEQYLPKIVDWFMRWRK
ncbi:MAG: thioesterase domain-containing protein, partial [Bacteroidota bacterium]